MGEKYQRGVPEYQQEKLPPKEIEARGNAIEDMIKGDGWKYMEDWLNWRIAVDTELICGFKSGEKETMDMKVERSICKAILRKPMEFIEDRNKLQT